MIVIDPGHVYVLDVLDDDTFAEGGDSIHFVKRIGEKYPGNEPPAHPGVTTQEVLRVLIDRTKYVDAQKPNWHNGAAIDDLRHALLLLEIRAHEERGLDVSQDPRLRPLMGAARKEVAIESLPTCPTCGHVCCTIHSVTS